MRIARSKRILDDWLYEFQWQLKQHPGEQGAVPLRAKGESWLIFADRDGVGEALAALLDAQGARSILVSHGDSYDSHRQYAFSYSSGKAGRPPTALRDGVAEPINRSAAGLSISGVLILLRHRRSPGLR